MDAVFTLTVQGLVLFLTLFLLYKFRLRMGVREVFEFSNFKKTKWYNFVLALPIGFLGLFVTIGVSTLWSLVLSNLGYNAPPSQSYLPETFNGGLFVLELILTALFPAFCEEFAMRGGFFTTMKKSYKGIFFYFIIAVSFGLFHQNIRQVFYTALFGAVMAFILLKVKSVWPCIVVHFVNNASSVCFDYAKKYKWPGGGLYDIIDNGLRTNFLLTFFIYLTILLSFIGLLLVLKYLNSAKFLKRKKDAILDSGFDLTNKRVIQVGPDNPGRVKELGLTKEVYGIEAAEVYYKPSLLDKSFYIGAIVITASFTLFSFVWGFFY
jgi:membrane protease YdiL (CAAX protease family)